MDLALGPVSNPPAPSNEELLEEVMGWDAVPKKGTVETEDFDVCFEVDVETGELSVLKFLQLDEESVDG